MRYAGSPSSIAQVVKLFRLRDMCLRHQDISQAIWFADHALSLKPNSMSKASHTSITLG